MKKLALLLVSAIYALSFVALFVVSELCHSASCRVHDDDPLGIMLFFFLPLLPVFVFSSTTYFMREEVFRAWWNFARWWVLVIVVASIFTSAIDNAQRGSSIGDFSMSVVILVPLYTLFIVISLVSITRAYLRARKR